MNWISVEDELPKNSTGNPFEYTDDVIIYVDGWGFDIGEYLPKENKWYSEWQEVKVTHWMPLPKPPESLPDEKRGSLLKKED